MAKLPLLPDNPEQVKKGRFPSWLHRSLPKGAQLAKTGKILNQTRLSTVCEEAKCPNLLECWSKKTATFLTMGKECTRNCGFCAIDFNRSPKPLETDEADRLVESIEALSLSHVVLTMVARDDLPDGGAAHLSHLIETIRQKCPKTTIEILTSDFAGNQKAWDLLIEASPHIFNYNIETVRELTPRVRHKATYERTLHFLSYIKQNRAFKGFVKSGLMLGLGEIELQVLTTLQDLKNCGCDIVTIGQYLQAAANKLLVKQFISLEQFKRYENYGYQIGLPFVYAGPFVRSSYNAETVLKKFNS